jgi:hypothetical protein
MSVLAQVAASSDTPLLITGLVGLAALGWKFVDFLRMLASLKTQVSGVVTQLVSWLGMILAVFLFGASQFGDTVNVAGKTLDTLDTPTKLLLGLVLGSVASAAVDFKQAFDNNDNASKPPLVK